MLRSLLSPEAQLLLLAAGGARSDPAIRALLRRELSWPVLLWLAQREGAALVLWQRLRSPECGGIPPEAAASLERMARVSEFRMRHLEGLLVQALDVLAGAGIEVVLLKGSALVCTIYGSFTHRPMGDIDLLLEPQRAHAARDLMLACGWRWNREELPDERYRGHHHLPPLDDPHGIGVHLELHTGLFLEGHPFCFSPEALWRESRHVAIGGRATRVPSDSHLLLHTCLHFAWSHAMELGGWRAIRDIDRIVGSGGVDWDEFLASARASRGTTSCFWALRLAQGLIGAPVPEDVLHRLRPPQAEPVIRTLERHFAMHPFVPEPFCPSVQLGRAMWQLAICPEWSGHGTARPWDHPGGAAPGQGLRRASAAPSRPERRSRLHTWTRYLHAMMRPMPAAQ